MSGHFMHTREMVGTIIIDDSTSVSILDDVDITFSSDFDMLEFNWWGGSESDELSVAGYVTSDGTEPSDPGGILTTEYDIAGSAVNIVQGTDAELFAPDFAGTMCTNGDLTFSVFFPSKKSRVRFMAHIVGAAATAQFHMQINAWRCRAS